MSHEYIHVQRTATVINVVAHMKGNGIGIPPLRNALIAAGIAILGFILGLLGIIPELVVNMLFVVAILLGAYHWAREGFEELIHEHAIDIEMLMIAATLGAIVLGLWEEAVTLVVLYAAAEGVEHITYARTRASIRKLLDLAPKEAVLIRNGAEQVIPADQLKVGDIFLVKPGAGIPTDGIIVKGRSGINEAAVTGESVPVEKSEGMKVFAATLNLDGALEVKTTATFKDNSLARMIHLVEEAQEQKGKTQAFIETVRADIYTSGPPRVAHYHHCPAVLRHTVQRSCDPGRGSPRCSSTVCSRHVHTGRRCGRYRLCGKARYSHKRGCPP